MRKKALCDFCGGELDSKKVDYEFKVKKEIIVVNGVKADVCRQCGQSYIDAETEEKIESIYLARKQTRPLRYIPVPVFSIGSKKALKKHLDFVSPL